MTPSDKQRAIRDLVVEHPQFTQTLNALERFHFPVKGGNPARGTLAAVIGDSRTGKTFATKHYASRFSTSVGETGRNRRRVRRCVPEGTAGGPTRFRRCLHVERSRRSAPGLTATRAVASGETGHFESDG